MKKWSSWLLIFSLLIGNLSAKEGMWLPILLKSLNQSDMQSMGLKLSAEDIYSINHTSLKDAVVSFGGFCTGELISNKGLILTNHHCGYRAIQSHSSVENDYLTDGFWAKTLKEELPNEGLTATFIVRMEDVTNEVLNDISADLSESERQKLIQLKIDSLSKLATAGTHYKAFIRPFYYGNEYYLFLTETFTDIRMVGAPPSSIGKFGGDADNWIWPRHTGDFSLFRIYADKDNNPADYSEENVPYQPKKFLPISLNGMQEGDFTMVYGFPGRTEEYLTSYAVDQIKNVLNPKKIAIREEALKVLDKHMKASDEVRIKYAAKYASIANYWKKWRGENRGLEQTNAIQIKKDKERLFTQATAERNQYQGLMGVFKNSYQEIEDYAIARSYFVEIPYRKIEIIGLAASFRKLAKLIETSKDNSESDEEREKLKQKVTKHFKDYDLATDKALAKVLLEKYKNDLPEQFVPKELRKNEISDLVDEIYEKSAFAKEKDVNKLLGEKKDKMLKKLKGDPAYQLMTAFYDNYNDEIRPEYNLLSDKIDSLSKIYMKGLQTYIPGDYYPDANSTLRLTYGKVDGFHPRDAVNYDFFTTTDGILEKYEQGSDDYDLPERLITLIKKKDYGQYANEDGLMPVCFIASNHTTGGNSGSPVINGNGELIGLNFDRNWEGTMSDINYDKDLCRNISVDVRYVLFIIDKYAGAQRLIDEMKLVKN